MKLKQIQEASYHGSQHLKKAAELIQDAIDNEREYLEDGDGEEDEELIYALEEILRDVKAGKIVSYDDIERVSYEIYNATSGGGMYGDTDLSNHISGELADLLGIKNINEARYHGEHPFIVNFFKNLMDPDVLSKTRYPEDIEYDTLKDVFTSKFGKPEKRSDGTGYLEWTTDLPDHLVKEYDMDKMYIYLHPTPRNIIEVMWD